MQGSRKTLGWPEVIGALFNFFPSVVFKTYNKTGLYVQSFASTYHYYRDNVEMKEKNISRFNGEGSIIANTNILHAQSFLNGSNCSRKSKKRILKNH